MPASMSEDPVSAEADIASLQAENASLHDRMLRALADAENTRRRAERTAEDARQYAVWDLARELLPVVDNLQRAIDAAQSRGGGDPSLVEGIRATERMLLGILERFGVRRIAALGARFDPSLHEAIMAMEDAANPPGTVVRVVEEGYTMRDRLLRPARVIVSRSATAAPSSEDQKGEEGDHRQVEEQSHPGNHNAGSLRGRPARG
jgi:molecular chaperone GrpE